MITYVKGDLFQSPAQVLVNTVNTVGVMGKGLAKQFKQIYPDMFKQYQTLCEQGKLNIGNLLLYKSSNKWVLNFPTKQHWRSPSKLEYIEAGLKKFSQVVAKEDIYSIAFPPLGCGNGELDWDEVRPLMESYLRGLPIDVFVYLYPTNNGKPEHQDIINIKKWLRGEPRSLGFVEFWDDLNKVINSSSFFQLFPNGASFSVEYTTSENTLGETVAALKINGGDHPWHILTENDLQWLWGVLRDFGMITQRILDDQLIATFPYVLSILEKLEYIDIVEVSTDKNNEYPFALTLVESSITAKTNVEQLQLSL